jgi:hypothetical protein
MTLQARAEANPAQNSRSPFHGTINGHSEPGKFSLILDLVVAGS